MSKFRDYLEESLNEEIFKQEFAKSTLKKNLKIEKILKSIGSSESTKNDFEVTVEYGEGKNKWTIYKYLGLPIIQFIDTSNMSDTYRKNEISKFEKRVKKVHKKMIKELKKINVEMKLKNEPISDPEILDDIIYQNHNFDINNIV